MSTNKPPADLQKILDVMLHTASDGTHPSWQPIHTEARHGLWRISEGNPRLVVKVYEGRVDKFFHHRWRREERALDLAARHAPGLAPAPRGAWLTPGVWAALAMDDLGTSSLADDLATATEAERSAWLDLALEALRGFENLTTHFAGMFRALVYQSDLDRITTKTIRRRYATGLARLHSTNMDHRDPRSPTPPWSTIDQWLVKPLAGAPRRVIHNGFSPLNLIRWRGRVAVLDWETLAVAPREFDLADLLTFGSWNLDGDAIEGRVAEHLDLNHGRGKVLDRFWTAAAERSLTYAATAHMRGTRTGSTYPGKHVQTERREQYLNMFRIAIERSGVPTDARRRLTSALPSGAGLGI